MSKDNRDFFKEKKDWSEIKDTLLGAYLKPYFQKVLMTKRPIFYVDCFSGKGRFDDGKPGSPIIALDIRKDCIAQTRSENAQIDMCFIDLNYASDLELNLSSYSSCYWKPAIFSGKYEEKIIEILKTKKNVNVFLYIDPYGIQALDSELFDIFSTFEFASFEMLINFNSFGFFREACRALKVDYTKDRALTDLENLVEYSPIQVEADQKSINLLNKIADGTYWQEIVRDFNMGKFDGYQAEELLSAGYKKQLRKRYSYVLDMPIQIKKTILPLELGDKKNYSMDNEYGITLISLDEKYREKMELYAAPYQQRIDALKALHDSGCKTWISMEPYPTPNLIDQDINELLEAVSFTDKIIFGRTNYCKEVSLGYPQHKHFYNEKAKQVIDFCEKNKIDSYIKEKTITPDI